MGLPLALYYLTKGAPAENLAVGTALPEMAERPGGALVWLHAPRPEDVPVVTDLLNRLADRDPDLSFLVTSDESVPEGMPAGTIWQPVPEETRHTGALFIRHWAPDVVGWLSDQLRPDLIAETAAAQIPIHLLDTGNALATTRYRSRIPGLRRTILRSFTTILAGDKATATAFNNAGVRDPRIRITGVLERGAIPLPCLEAERDTLAHLFAARPVWLAAEVQENEYEAVLAAHSAALRRTHRLLLILVPSDASDGPTLAKMLTDLDLTFEMRSAGAEPEAETQVYVADTEGEMGLWYRLAPTSFLGHSFTVDGGTGPHPFDAAALGSVVLHGPQTSQHRDPYLRLQRAGASQEVANAVELAAGVEELLAPDKAAEMAHSAWQVCSAGAEAADIALDLLSKDAAMRRSSQ